MLTRQRAPEPNPLETEGHAIDRVFRGDAGVLAVARVPIAEGGGGWPEHRYLVADLWPDLPSTADGAGRHEWAVRHADIRLRFAEPAWSPWDADAWLDEQETTLACPALLTAVVFPESTTMRLSTGDRLEAVLEGENLSAATMLPAAVLYTFVAARGRLDAVPARMSICPAGAGQMCRATVSRHRIPASVS